METAAAGKGKIGLAMVPPALPTASNAASRSSTRITGSGADRLRRIALQADIDVAVGRRRIIGP